MNSDHDYSRDNYLNQLEAAIQNYFVKSDTCVKGVMVYGLDNFEKQPGKNGLSLLYSGLVELRGFLDNATKNEKAENKSGL